MTGIRKRSTKPLADQRKLKGPADRVKELEVAHRKTLGEALSGESNRQGYDARTRLKGIRREIKRLGGR